MRNINTGSARSVGVRRIMKHYLLSNGSVIASRSPSGARKMAGGLLVQGLTTKPVAPAPPGKPVVAPVVGGGTVAGGTGGSDRAAAPKAASAKVTIKPGRKGKKSSKPRKK